jgi:glycolate oxidase
MTEKMELPEAARRDFESIVGARFYSHDPAMLSAHVWCTGVGKIPGDEKYARTWPAAVVLPGSTEEVAAVVKCCLRHGLSYRAHSTGYGSMSHVMSKNSIVIDLRRMNGLKIDPANRMAVIGPYVTAGMLQAEALKHGLTCHIVGAGPAHSPLASATSLIGVGITSQGTSMNSRNLLAWEWVTPQGEIIRGGSSAVNEDDWFAGEGPGPGVRGLLRGFFGAGGGLGVFTKIGYKLYPVPVQGPLPTTGRLPQLGLPIPENSGFFQAVWPDWESHRQAAFELVDENLCFAMLRMPPDHIGWTVTGTNAEFVRRTREGTLPVSARPENDKNWTLLTLSRSAAEQAWRAGVVRDIVERTGGRLLELERDEAEVLCRNLVTSHYVPRVMRPSGGITTSFGILDSMHFLPRAMEAGEECLGGQNRPGGALIQGGREEHWSWPHEGRYLWSENIIDFDPASKKAREAAARALLGHFAISFKVDKPIGVIGLNVGPIMELQGKRIGGPQYYIRQLKHEFDPTNASQSPDFIPFNMPWLLQKALPILRPVILSGPVIALAAKGIASKGL